MPFRAMQLWDEDVRLALVEELNAWESRNAGKTPTLEATADAIERLAAGDLRSAQILARQALDHVNAGVTA